MITKNNKAKLQEYFFNYPSKALRVREIERATKLPLPSVTRYAQELAKEGILQEKILGDTKFYTASRASPAYRREKMLFNLRALHECGLVERLIEEFHNAPIRLFGSYSRGEDTEESDIDIFVQTPLEGRPLERFESQLKRKIHLFTAKDIREMENRELANNILNGIPLNGHIEAL